MSEIKMSVGSYQKKVVPMLRELRNMKGLTQRELADTSGVSASMIAKVETGLSEPSLTILEKLMDAMDFQLIIVAIKI